jgi:hypothetical protein
MRTLLFLLLTGVALADPITVGPIPISGSGFWEWEYGPSGSGMGVSFGGSGTNGVDSISIFISDGTDNIPPLFTPTPPTGLSQIYPCPDGGITVNGIHTGPPKCLNYGFQGDAGFVDFKDGFFGPITLHADLTGYFNVTGYSEHYMVIQGTNRLVSMYETFTITATPEPSTASMLIAAFLLLVGWRGTRTVPHRLD